MGRILVVVSLIALAGALAAAPARLAAQCQEGRASELEVAPLGVVQEVTLEGRTRYQGRVLEVGKTVRFELLSGDVLELSRDRIRCLRVVAGRVQDGEFWPEDPNATRLFFGPTGRALRQGEGYLSVFEVLFPMVAVGVTDRITMAGGMPLVFGGGLDVFWLAPKVQVIRTPRSRTAVGVLTFFSPSSSDMGGVLYAVTTLGETSDAAVTLGAGWAWERQSGIHDTPALMAGLEQRLSRRVKLVSENYWFPDGGFGLVSVGPRFMGERLSADLGLMTPITQGGGFFAFPLINFAYNW